MISIIALLTIWCDDTFKSTAYREICHTQVSSCAAVTRKTRTQNKTKIINICKKRVAHEMG